ncbi:MAG: 2-amino-4-hydroxy-6-hydroxymethyldihydropteridine diphosphokinase [Planctomycetota bacterium]
MAVCLLGLGSNQGDRQDHLTRAIDRLAQLEGVSVTATSGLRETEPIGGTGHQQRFLNATCLLETTLSPQSLWTQLAAVEIEFGRQRKGDWGPRTLDLDLLLYEQQVIWEPQLKVPHPWMLVRPFVMEPAAEIAAHMVHPLLDTSLGDLCDTLRHEVPRACVLSHGDISPPTELPFEMRVADGHLAADTLSGRAVEPAAPAPQKLPSVLWATPRDFQKKPSGSQGDVSQSVRLFIGLVDEHSLGALWNAASIEGIDKIIVQSIVAYRKPFVLISRDRVATQLAPALAGLGPTE